MNEVSEVERLRAERDEAREVAREMFSRLGSFVSTSRYLNRFAIETRYPWLKREEVEGE